MGQFLSSLRHLLVRFLLHGEFASIISTWGHLITLPLWLFFLIAWEIWVCYHSKWTDRYSRDTSISWRVQKQWSEQPGTSATYKHIYGFLQLVFLVGSQFWLRRGEARRLLNLQKRVSQTWEMVESICKMTELIAKKPDDIFIKIGSSLFWIAEEENGK